MIGDERNKITYRVEYRTWAQVQVGDHDRNSIGVDLYPGHTEWGEIPRIIAANRGLRAQDVVIVSAELVGITLDGVRR